MTMMMKKTLSLTFYPLHSTGSWYHCALATRATTRAMTTAREVVLVSVAIMTARAREVSIGDHDNEKDSLTHFLSFALHRFMVLCSGKSDDDGKGKSGKGKGGSGGQGDDTWMITARARVALARVTMMTMARAKVAKVSGSLDNNSN